jgi:putative SOS response-associated peptidase YedK
MTEEVEARLFEPFFTRKPLDVLAIRFNPATKRRTLDTLRWGLIPNWTKDPKIAYKRVETVDTAPARKPEIALTRQRQTTSGISTPKLAPPQFPG